MLTSRVTPLATAGELRSVTYAPRKRRFAVRGSAKRVRCGARKRETVIFVPARVKARRIAAKGARLRIARRGKAHEVHVYPNGGPYRVSTGAGPRRRCP
jgi:hypothetical protein